MNVNQQNDVLLREKYFLRFDRSVIDRLRLIYIQNDERPVLIAGEAKDLYDEHFVMRDIDGCTHVCIDLAAFERGKRCALAIAVDAVRGEVPGFLMDVNDRFQQRVTQRRFETKRCSGIIAVYLFCNGATWGIARQTEDDTICTNSEEKVFVMKELSEQIRTTLSGSYTEKETVTAFNTLVRQLERLIEEMNRGYQAEAAELEKLREKLDDCGTCREDIIEKKEELEELIRKAESVSRGTGAGLDVERKTEQLRELTNRLSLVSVQSFTRREREKLRYILDLDFEKIEEQVDQLIRQIEDAKKVLRSVKG